MLFFLVLLATFLPVMAQPPVRGYVQAHQMEILREFVDLPAIPNVASDLNNLRSVQ
jgi:hypothetical protein